MDIDDKLRPIYLVRILKKRTDEDHYLTTSQLCSILKDEFGMETHRTTIKSDIEMLQKAGFAIQTVRSTQNQYNFIEREFDDPELKMLIDAVQSAKFITKKKSDQLVSKLTALASVNKAQELKRNLVVDGRTKLENEQILIIVDAINEAINRGKKIKFQMTKYNVKKKRVLHNDGEVYIFSPYTLIWDGDFYYVIGYSEKYQSIGSHRVDRIYKRPEILDEQAASVPDGFDINAYVNTMFHMYDAERVEVELQVDNSLMDAIIDKFGPDVMINDYDEDNFRAAVTVSVGTPFFNWVFGFQGKVAVISPESVRQAFENRVREVAQCLELI